MINKNSKGKQNSKFGYASKLKRPFFFLLGSYQEDKAIIIFFPQTIQRYFIIKKGSKITVVKVETCDS